MTTVYLIRHSIKSRNYNFVDSEESFQIRNEKISLSKEGEEKALLLSKHSELQNINEVWSSNYVRAIQTAKYISENNNVNLNISQCFDERHYGTFETNTDKEEFWIEQFKNVELKNNDGESQKDVQKRFERKLLEIIENNKNKKVAIVCHNACILFYLLKYCKLENAVVNKKLTISYKNKLIINDGILKSPSIIKLEFNEQKELEDLNYFEI